nr:unnamed protein product [Callosobruchus chinensis]
MKSVGMIRGAAKHSVVYLLILAANFIYGTSNTKDIHLTEHDKWYVWSPESSETLTVTTDEGCQIVVQLLYCNLDGDQEEYATLSTGPSKARDGLLFTYSIKEKPVYLYNGNQVYAEVILVGHSTQSKIKLNFTRIGEAAATSTSNAPTTTETPLYPTPSGNVSDYSIVVYVSGKTLAQFRAPSTKQMFKEALSEMAKEFCSEHSIKPSIPITASTVDILWTSECPPLWTECAPCASSGFAIPLNFNTTAPPHEYELTAQNLDSMWRKYAVKYLKEGLTVCPPPDTVKLVKWQLIAFSAITVTFVVILLVIRYFTIRINDRIRGKTLKIDEQWSNKQSILKDLGPHPLQEMPPIFEDSITDHNQYVLVPNPVEQTYTTPLEGKDQRRRRK